MAPPRKTMASSWSSFLRKEANDLKDLLRNSIFFYKRASFIFGLVFSRAFVEYAVTYMLIIYLTSNWASENLTKATAIINLQDGVSEVLTSVLAYISHAWTGRFLMVAITTTLYIIGLVLLWLRDQILTQRREAWVIYVALMLIALATAGLRKPLEEYFADQIKKSESKPDRDEQLGGMPDRNEEGKKEKDVEAIVEVWWRIARFSGATLATFTLAKDIYSWQYSFKVSAIIMGVALLVFCFGFFYSNGCRLAAIVKSGENQSKENIFTVTQMVPMLLTFLVYSLVQATGDTFFIEQSTNLEDNINGYTVPFSVFFLMKTFSNVIVVYLCNLLIKKYGHEEKQHRYTLMIIGFGMVSCVLCCITAMAVEIRRLDLVRKAGLEDNTADTISMSIFWLTPQYCLLGVMEGLAGEGLQNIFNGQADLVLGIGKFITIACLFIFKSWFGPTINHSHLDRYYKMLVFPSLVNLFIYIGVSVCYYWKKVLQAEKEKERVATLKGEDGGETSKEDRGST